MPDRNSWTIGKGDHQTPILAYGHRLRPLGLGDPDLGSRPGRPDELLTARLVNTFIADTRWPTSSGQVGLQSRAERATTCALRREH